MFACVHSRGAQLPLPGLSDAQQPLLVECAYSFSPRVEETAPGTVIADLEGCGHLFGSDAAIAEKMARRAAELGLDVSVTVAANPDAAACAAIGLPGVTLIPPGREAEMLGPLPVQAIAGCTLAIRNSQSVPAACPGAAGKSGSAIRNSPGVGGSRLREDNAGRLREILETLEAWGIRTLGQLAALPVAGLSERLGRDGLRLRELARGASTRALIPAVPAPGFEKSIDLEYSVALLDPLLFVIASLLNQLCRNLEERALATNEITVRLRLEDRQTGETAAEGSRFKVQGSRLTSAPDHGPQTPDHGPRTTDPRPRTTDRGPRTTDHLHERVLRLPVPMLNNQAFLRLVQLDLEQHPPPAPVVAVWIRTRPVKPRALQDGLFVPLAPEPQKLELTLARITKLVGTENAGAAEVLDTHRPDAFAIKRFEVRGEKVRGARCEVRGAAGKGRGARGEGRGENQSAVGSSNLAPRTSHLLGFRHFRPPLAAQVETAREQPARVAARGIRGKVVSLSGPWRTAGDWWSPQPWDRDEWDVALAGGSLYRIYFDRRRHGWFVEGSYD